MCKRAKRKMICHTIVRGYKMFAETQYRTPENLACHSENETIGHFMLKLFENVHFMLLLGLDTFFYLIRFLYFFWKFLDFLPQK